MMIDKETLLSDAQELTTVSVASTNILDLGNDNALVQAMNEKGQLEVFAQVNVAITGNGTSVALSLQSDDDVAFGSAKTLYTSAAIAKADLVAGYKFPVSGLPRINEQYLRAYFTLVGTFAAGSVHVGLVNALQTNGV